MGTCEQNQDYQWMAGGVSSMLVVSAGSGLENVDGYDS